MKKTYRKYREIFAELERYCTKLCQEKHTCVLPSTRALAVELGTNRVTLGKAIDLAEQKGLLCRTPKGLKYQNQLETYKGRIIFLTTGFWDAPSLGAWCRLWNSLHLHAVRYGMNVTLCLTNNQVELKDVLLACGEADLVLYTTAIIKEGLPADSIIKALNQRGIPVISLSEANSSGSFICLDNHALGITAARTLEFAGCMRPAVIYKGTIPSYSQRKEGFCQWMSKQHIAVECFNSDENPLMDIYGYFQTRLEEAVLHQCDGAFIVSDEGIAHITFNVFQRHLVPEKLKLITVHGSGEALTCTPPVSCISHGTQAVLDTLLWHFSQIQQNGGHFLPIQRYVEPTVNITQTLGENLRPFANLPMTKLVAGSL